ncbi:hypothetical protein CO709_16295 [Burkholderia thailandensis]|nr:hypothetical protein CO709_16295 [Burkholderia thailandensis]
MSGFPGRPSMRRASRYAAARARRGPACAARPKSTLSRTISELCIVSEAGSRRCPPHLRRRPPNTRKPAAFLTRWKLQP